MSEIICEFCEKSFAEKRYLKLHQKKTKYCLKIQEEYRLKKEKLTKDKQQSCSGCGNTFADLYTLKRHTNICLDYQLDQQKKKFYDIIKEEHIKFDEKINDYMESYENKIEFYKNVIEEQKETIQKLQNIIENSGDRLERIVNNTTKTMGDVATNTTNKMGEVVTDVATAIVSKSGNKIVNIQNNFNKVEPFDEKWIEDKAKLLTFDDIGNYHNLSTFIARNIMSNVYMSDKSRKKVTYKDKNGNIQKSKDLYELIVRTLTVLMPKIKDCLEEFKGIYNCPDDFTRVSSMEQFIAKLERISKSKALTVQEREMLNNLIKNITLYVQDEQQFNDLDSKDHQHILIENPKNLQDNTLTIENFENINSDEEENDSISKDSLTVRFKNLRIIDQIHEEDNIIYEFKYNHYRNIKKVYEKYGDYYIDDEENVIHPIEFEKRDRFKIKKFLEDIEPKKIHDLDTNIIPEIQSMLLLTKLG
jgi:hypothetical protein